MKKDKVFKAVSNVKTSGGLDRKYLNWKNKKKYFPRWAWKKLYYTVKEIKNKKYFYHSNDSEG